MQAHGHTHETQTKIRKDEVGTPSNGILYKKKLVDILIYVTIIQLDNNVSLVITLKYITGFVVYLTTTSMLGIRIYVQESFFYKLMLS